MGFVVRATWTAAGESVDLVRSALAELAPLSRGEPGNQHYIVHQDPARPRVFEIFEVYDDEDAYRAHAASEHFGRLAVNRAIPALESRERAFFQTLDL